MYRQCNHIRAAKNGNESSSYLYIFSWLHYSLIYIKTAIS